MDKQILLTYLKPVKDYCKSVVIPYLIGTLKKIGKPFVEALWKQLKKDIRNQLILGLGKVSEYVTTDDAKEKEKFLLDFIMSNINLPFALKPFKGLIKNIIKGKLEKFIHLALVKAHTIL